MNNSVWTMKVESWEFCTARLCTMRFLLTLFSIPQLRTALSWDVEMVSFVLFLSTWKLLLSSFRLQSVDQTTTTTTVSHNLCYLEVFVSAEE